LLSLEDPSRVYLINLVLRPHLLEAIWLLTETHRKSVRTSLESCIGAASTLTLGRLRQLIQSVNARVQTRTLSTRRPRMPCLLAPFSRPGRFPGVPRDLVLPRNLFSQSRVGAAKRTFRPSGFDNVLSACSGLLSTVRNFRVDDIPQYEELEAEMTCTTNFSA
jgi:hypothetical protein